MVAPSSELHSYTSAFFHIGNIYPIMKFDVGLPKFTTLKMTVDCLKSMMTDSTG